ncbi:hypothetical protein [Lacticaseibacillus sp. GG6-2]
MTILLNIALGVMVLGGIYLIPKVFSSARPTRLERGVVLVIVVVCWLVAAIAVLASVLVVIAVVRQHEWHWVVLVLVAIYVACAWVLGRIGWRFFKDWQR